VPTRRWLAITGCVVALAAAAATGCGGGSTATSSGRRSDHAVASPKPTSAPLSAWQQLGATEVPPASLRQAGLGATQVVNQAAGAVSDADAQTWAQAVMRTFGYLNWAVSQGQDAFLVRSGLSSVPHVVLQPNLTDIAEARQAGVRVQYRSETIRRLLVRPVPESLQPLFGRYQYAWKPYAIFLDAVGPAATTWVDAQGNQTVKSQIPAGAAAYELVGGELQHNSLMGDIWVMDSDWSCTSAPTQQALAPVCNS
jgi:hypothetical protein